MTDNKETVLYKQISEAEVLQMADDLNILSTFMK